MRFPVSTVAPRPHPRVVECTVDGARAVFHLDDRRLHVLNGSAGAIWAVLAESATVGEVTIAVADRFAVAPETVRDDVERLIERFRADGLVTVDDRVQAVRCTRPVPAPLPDTDRQPVSGAYIGLDAAVAVECDDEEIGRVLDDVLGCLRSDRAPTTGIRVGSTADGRFEVAVDDRPPQPLSSRLGVVLRVLAELNAAAVRSAPDDLVLHAGAVSRDGAAVLLPAASNQGKSTLVTALVRAGFGYLTDEAAALAEGLVVRPFPKAIALDPGSFPLFPDLEPGPNDGLARALAGREWHIDPRRVGTVADPAPVRAVVRPHWRAGAVTRVHRCGASEALHVLLGDAFDFSEGGQPVFDRLAELVATVPVYRLGYSDLGDAVPRVAELLDAAVADGG